MSNVNENVENIVAAEEVNENVPLTDEQVSYIYNELDKENTDKEALSQAQEETENTEYEEIESINPALDSEEELPPEDALKKILKESSPDITDEDAETVIKLLLEYKKNKNIIIYNRLPDSYKKIIDDIKFNINRGRPKSQLIGKEHVARFYFDNIVSDAQFEAIFDEFNKSMDDAYREFNLEISDAFKDAYNELFSKIEEIGQEDPEKAQKLTELKNAFDDAKSFNRLLGWLEPRRRKRIYKRAELYFNDEVSYFNSKVNTTEIKVPDISKLLNVLNLYDPERPEIEHKRFIVAICQHATELNMDNINDLAYVYKLVDNIYKYTFNPAILEDDETKQLFENVYKVIDKINSL